MNIIISFHRVPLRWQQRAPHLVSVTSAQCLPPKAAHRLSFVCFIVRRCFFRFNCSTDRSLSSSQQVPASFTGNIYSLEARAID